MKSCPKCERTFDDTFTFCLDDGTLLSAPHDDAEAEATQRIPPPRVTNLTPTPLPPTVAAKAPEFSVVDSASSAQPKSQTKLLLVGGLIALALVSIAAIIVVGAIVALNMTGANKDSKQSNKQTTTNQNTNSAASPDSGPLKGVFPQTVGAFTLEGTYERHLLEGDDKYLPNAGEVMGAVYKSSANKKVQVIAGSYNSEDDAEAARVKRVSSSKYISRWTSGKILYVATDSTFKDQL